MLAIKNRFAITQSRGGYTIHLRSFCMNKRLLFRGRSKLDTVLLRGDRVSALELSLGVAEKQRTSSLNTAFSSALHEGKRLDLHEPKFLLRRPRVSSDRERLREPDGAAAPSGSRKRYVVT